MPAMRNDTETAGPASAFATGPASAKMPAPMIAPSPIAVSCHSPMLRSRALSPPSFSIGLRRKIPLAGATRWLVPRAWSVMKVSSRLARSVQGDFYPRGTDVNRRSGVRARLRRGPVLRGRDVGAGRSRLGREPLARGDAGVEELAQPGVGVGDRRHGQPAHGAPHDVGSRALLELLRGDGRPTGEPAYPDHRAGEPVERLTYGPEALDGTRREPRPHLLAPDQSGDERALRGRGYVVQGVQRDRGGHVHHPRQAAATQAHHGRDHHGELAAVPVAGVVVDQPSQVPDQWMGAPRMVAPRLVGEHGGHLHEAGALAGGTVLAPGKNREAVGDLVRVHESTTSSTTMLPAGRIHQDPWARFVDLDEPIA